MTLEYFEVKRDLIQSVLDKKANEWADYVVTNNGEDEISNLMKRTINELGDQLDATNDIIANLRAE